MSALGLYYDLQGLQSLFLSFGALVVKPFFLQIGVAEGWIYVLAETPEGAPFRAYDPIAAKWFILPPTPGRSEGQQWQGFACVALGHRVLLIGGTRSQLSPTSGNYSSGACMPPPPLSFHRLTHALSNSFLTKKEKGNNINLLTSVPKLISG